MTADDWMSLAVIAWLLCGIVGHIVQSNEMKTWCGTPVWDEPLTYWMFFPAMLLGPITFFLFEEYPDRDQRNL